MSRAARLALAVLALAAAAPAQAAREPVLSQVKLPHNYYWRELYIPQLTTGPSSAAFMPSGDELIYSMRGSLWRQQIGTGDARELTHPPGGYDHQPDVSPDGGSVVFARYDGKGFELWRQDLATGAEQALTANGGVNLEPRISPDGRRIVFVSTAGPGHFNLKIADLSPAGIANERFLVQPRESAIDRYYYSTHDHMINPSWSPDGQRVWYVTNAETPWGTGWICSIAVAGGEPACLDHHQLETSWDARPEVGPDGRRILFSNYHGGQWHQLWLTTTDDKAPLPLTYGEFDRTNARWSPDGKRIAYISNEGGNTSLWVQDFFGGARKQVATQDLRRRAEAATLVLRPQDASGRAISARVAVLGSDGRWHAPAGSWMHGDELYDRAQFPSEVHYFHCPAEGTCSVELPPGKARIHVQSGFRRMPVTLEREIPTGRPTELPVRLGDNDLPPEFGKFLSADLHVHMNYGGHYRNTPERLLAQQEAEDLDVVYNLLVNKEERIPDIGYFKPGGNADAASGKRLLFHAQEYHTSFWGHMGLLNLEDHYLLPDYAAYRHTAYESPWPNNGAIADLARAQGGIVGYVHIADFPIDPPKEKTLSYELPASVAHGKVDYLEVMGFSDHHITAGIWYRLLNLGFRLPAGAGTDAMPNYASLHGPIGLVRVFLETGRRAHAAGPGRCTEIRPHVRQQRSTARAGGRWQATRRRAAPLRHAASSRGATFAGADGPPRARAERARGQGVHAHRRAHALRLERRHRPRGRRLGGAARLQRCSRIPGCSISTRTRRRARSTSTAPPPPAPDDAAYFVAWMDRVVEATLARGGWNSEQEKADTLAYLEAAREKFRALAANMKE